MLNRSFCFILCTLILLISGLNCAKIDNPLAPSLEREGLVPSGRWLWGIWEARVVPDSNGSAQVLFVPLRTTDLHMNVVGMMESGGKPAVGIIPPVKLENGILDVTVKLTHPFPNPKLTGFDVRGILIGHGSIGGFSEAMFYAGPDDLELLNADGHTRLWNPTEYSGSGYVDGKLGKPDAIANYTATLNGYKYFADSLTPDMPVHYMLKAKRGAFSAGASNSRHYKIRLGNKGLTFQYAVDANWFKPTEPVKVPESFDVTKANCPEPYHIEAKVGPGIYGGGGSASVTVDVYDWQKDVTSAFVEAPLLTDQVIELKNPQNMGDFVRFSGTLTNVNLPPVDSVDLLFYARGVDPVTSKTYTDYRLYHLPLVRVPPEGVVITLQDDMAYKTIGVTYTYGGKDYNWGTGDPAPVDYKDLNGPWDFTSIPNNASALRVALAKTDPEVAGFADDFNPAVTHFFKTEWSLGGSPDQVYQAESHDVSANKLKLWGVYEEKELQGSVPFDPPLDFPYPMDKTTHYKINQKYTIIPFLLTFTITFERWGMGEGVTFIPVEPGVNGWGWEAYPALETRTWAKFETGGALGKGVLGTALLYEWIADNGTSIGSVGAGNTPDDPPNFNETTYEIIGVGTAQALRAID